MSLSHSPSIVMNGLVMVLDANNIKSYAGSGTKWADVFYNGNDGQLSNVTYTTGSISYMDFTAASSSTVSLGSVLNWTASPFSYSYWIYLNNYTTSNGAQGPVPFFKGAYQQNGYYNQIASDGGILFATSQAGVVQNTISVSGSAPLNTWINICTTRSGASAKIYVNGVDVTTVSGTHINPTSSSEPFRIGSYNQTSGGVFTIYGNMRISTFIGYNTALSPSEVLQNFNALKGRYGL